MVRAPPSSRSSHYAPLLSLSWFFPDHLKSPSARSLLVAMLHPNPSYRPTMAQLAQNLWVNGHALGSEPPQHGSNNSTIGQAHSSLHENHCPYPTLPVISSTSSLEMSALEGSHASWDSALSGAAAEEALGLGEGGLDHVLARALQLSFDDA